MASRRKIIRKRLVSILKNQTDAGERVFSNASVPSWIEELPVILVYPRTEDAEKFNQAPLEFRRDINMLIEVQVKGTEQPFDTQKGDGLTAEDALDDIIEQIECAIFKDDSLGCDDQNRAIADEVLISSTEFEFESDGAQTIGGARLNLVVTYYEHAPESVDKQAGLGKFSKVHADWHVGHDDDDPDLTNKEAEDDVVIPDS